MEREIQQGIATTTLSAEVKDELADHNRDRSKSYHQEIAHFIEQSSLFEYVSAMFGASRVLRNSDHVDPDLRKELLDQILLCWVGFCQVITILSRALAGKGRATFEGIGFMLGSTFDNADLETRWQTILKVAPYNIVNWFHEEVFSKKLGPLFVNHLENNALLISDLFTRRVLIIQRPPGWEEVIKRFITSEHKNSYALFDVHSCLRHELRIGVSSEKAAIQIRTLTATAMAKHITGKKKPDQKLVEKVAKKIPFNSKQEPDKDMI